MPFPVFTRHFIFTLKGGGGERRKTPFIKGESRNGFLYRDDSEGVFFSERLMFIDIIIHVTGVLLLKGSVQRMRSGKKGTKNSQ